MALERLLQHLLDPAHRMDVETVLDLVGNLRRSFTFSSGISTRLDAAAPAARSFSFKPPIGSTSPRSVISPVIATSQRTGYP
jgi:hypothetical protein